MTVSELARLASVTADTVRHYTRIGLLQPTRDEHNGYYCYRQGDISILLFIRKARLLGFKLGDIRDILKESRHGHSPCQKVRKIMEQRLQETLSKIRHLEKIQRRMEYAEELWAQMPDGMPDGDSVCHLIERIATEV